MTFDCMNTYKNYIYDQQFHVSIYVSISIVVST